MNFTRTADIRILQITLLRIGTKEICTEEKENSPKKKKKEIVGCRG